MASSLAAIYGSEQDKVNCSFYLKIGACRHGDRCSRKHIKPTFSQTLVVQNMFQNPLHTDPSNSGSLTPEDLQSYFDSFYEDVFCELVKYGHLLEMHVCDNVGDHLIGNVYARFEWEDEAGKATLFAELSPVTDFREACCRQNDMGECNRGGFCNFMHIQAPSAPLLKQLQAQQRVERRLNPDPMAAEREKEMAMFSAGGEFGNGSSGRRDDRDRDRDRDRRRGGDRDGDRRRDGRDRDRDRRY
ncbi:hypothetical protein BT69DRAFT_1313275 [Atractiella rhizophila]|nr:hypothetical protein BT69DRAFT_1313275 [Atractiella rhizophila]